MTAEKQRKRRVVAPPAPAGVRLIRKYGNRRLYDTHTSRYVTLGDLVEVFAGEEEVKVVDAVSGEDLTKRVLAQAILRTAGESDDMRSPRAPGLFSVALAATDVSSASRRLRRAAS